MASKSTYRMAGRLLRYRIHVLVGLLWVLASAWASFLYFFRSSNSPYLLSAVCLLALIYSGRVIALQPWQLLKAVLLGLAIYLLGFVAPVSMVTPAIVLASAFYMHLGDRFTEAVAERNMMEAGRERARPDIEPG